MRHIPEAGAVCGNSARTDLCGGRGVTSVPTATAAIGEFSDALRNAVSIRCDRDTIAVIAFPGRRMTG